MYSLIRRARTSAFRCISDSTRDMAQRRKSANARRCAGALAHHFVDRDRGRVDSGDGVGRHPLGHKCHSEARERQGSESRYREEKDPDPPPRSTDHPRSISRIKIVHQASTRPMPPCQRMIHDRSRFGWAMDLIDTHGKVPSAPNFGESICCRLQTGWRVESQTFSLEAG